MVAMANVIVRLLGNVIDLVGMFIDIALKDPLSFVLVVTSGVLLVFTFGIMTYLTLGAVFSGVIPENIGQTPPQQNE
jgi:hypothetical protein